jgi:AbiU2
MDTEACGGPEMSAQARAAGYGVGVDVGPISELCEAGGPPDGSANKIGMNGQTTSSIERLKTDIRRMKQEVIVLQGCFDAWWLIAGKPTRKKYLSALQDYNAFFLFGQHAFFTAFIVVAYKIWDKRDKDVLTIHRLAAEAEKISGFWEGADAKLDNLKRKRDRGERVWRKIGILRNEYFAHLNIDRPLLDVFKKAEVKPNELRSLVEASKDIVNSISYQIDRSSHVFNVTPKYDGTRLLDLLLRVETPAS